jgi:hypothetical protein
VSADSALSFLSAGIAVASVAAIFLPLRLRGTITGRALTVGGVFYVAYLGLVVGGLARGAA